jgi:hypothetical protein
MRQSFGCEDQIRGGKGITTRCWHCLPSANTRAAPGQPDFWIAASLKAAVAGQDREDVVGACTAGAPGSRWR